MESLRSTNDILHGQVQSLGIQVSRLQESRAAVTLTVGQSGVSSTASTSASSEGGVLLKIILTCLTLLVHIMHRSISILWSAG